MDTVNYDDIQVLVCDDSALMRNLISRIIDSTQGMHTAGTAMNGEFCTNKIPLLNPDCIIMDIEMPVMNGIEFLKKRKELKIDIPVIMLSSIATSGAGVTMQCLELGASDFITKPNGSSVSADINSVAAKLIEVIASYGGRYARSKNKHIHHTDFFLSQTKKFEPNQSVETNEQLLQKAQSNLQKINTNSSFTEVQKKIESVKPLREGGRIEVIAIGISTGGPNALREVFANIDPQLKQPVLIVQHMPAGFTKEFAASLNKICPLEVKEAEDGDIVKSGRVLIAPGDYHIYVEAKALANVVRLSHDEVRNGHRPSVDVLFESIASVYENRALGVIMTGMGRDGAKEITEMRRQGAWTLGQDEKSSIVYGMPKVAWEMGAIQKQVSLQDMAKEISLLAKEHA